MTAIKSFLNRTGWPLGLWRNRIPGQLVIQTTERCNAACPQCGMNLNLGGPRADLDLDRIKSLVDAAAERGFAAVSFTGGEPLLRLDDLVEMINHAGAAGIRYLRTGTNGYFLARPDRPGFRRRVGRVAEALAATPLRNFWISLDSADPATHERMRGFPGMVEGLARAIPIFHAHGLFPSVNLGFNRNLGGPATAGLRPAPAEGEARYLARFRQAFGAALKKFYLRALDLGFTMANTCYPMSLGGDDQDLTAVYQAASEETLVRFSRAEKAAIFQVLLEVVPLFRAKLRIFSPLSALLALRRQYHPADRAAWSTGSCRGGLDYFFVDAKRGHTFPCGYRGGEGLGRLEELEPARVDRSIACRRCDWECFRDPSEMFGPLLLAARRPLTALGRMGRDPEYRRAWLADLAYYRACRFFDGRRPPEYDRLAGFSFPDAAARTGSRTIGLETDPAAAGLD